MYGNVSEFVQNFYQTDYYPQINAKGQVDLKGEAMGMIDPKHPDAGKLHVRRGGYVLTETKFISSVYRCFSTSKLISTTGFRLAYDPPKSP